jgi:hypothetical protein
VYNFGGGFMEKNTNIKEIVKGLKENQKFDIIRSYPETKLHWEIKELLSVMYKDSYIDVTHGNNELGKDLVVLSNDELGDRLTGIIVKVGDIKGETAGAIKEIKDQVEQSFSHPVSIKYHEFEGEYDTTFVTIIIAGNLSGQALRRLKGEINRPVYRTNVSIRDMKWLVDNFTKYYPYVFYEGKVSEYIESKINELEKKHMFSARERSLTEYYVDPYVASYEQVIALSDPNITFTIIKNRGQFHDLLNNSSVHEKYLLVGDPGVGKSTALAKLAIDGLSDALSKATKEDIKHKIGIPMFITASEFMKVNNQNDLFEINGLSSETRERFEICNLFIDGLDEAKSEERENILKKASNIANELHCGLIVSTRKIDIVKKEAEGFTKRELLPFEFGQAMILLQRLVKDKDMLESLKSGLLKIKDQMQITPLSLLLLVELVENNKEVPASLAELYDRFSDLALGINDRGKGIDILFDYKIKKEFLAELAFEEFYNKGRIEISTSELIEYINKYATSYKWDKHELEVFVDEIKRAGILNVRDEIVKFSHLSFLDFFIATRVFNERDEIDKLYEYLTKIYFDPYWNDVALFFAGLRTKIPKKWVDTVFTYNKGDDSLITNVQRLLFGRLLQAAWHSTSSVKMYGIGKSLGFADIVPKQFLEKAKERNPSVSGIYADIYTLILAEMAFGSRFLLNEARELITRYLEKPTGKNLNRGIKLLWSIKGKIEDSEKIDYINKLYEAVNKTKYISEEEYARSLLLLRIMAATDKIVFRTIEKRVQLILKNNPKAFTGIVSLSKQPSITREQKEKARIRKKKSNKKA